MLTGISTLHDVCAVHWGVCEQWEMFSTPREYHEYTGGISWVHVGGVQHTRGISWYTGGFSCFCRFMDFSYGFLIWISWQMWGRSLGKQLNLCGNPSVLNIPQCTHDISPHWSSHSSWYPPSVLVISPTLVMVPPRSTHGIPHCTDHPRCAHDIPPVHWTPPVYWTSPGVLHSPRCTAQTLCRVISKECDYNMFMQRMQSLGFSRSLLTTLLVEVYVFCWKTLAGLLLKHFRSLLI